MILPIAPQHQMFVCIHKHYTVEEWVQFGAENPDCLPVCFTSDVNASLEPFPHFDFAMFVYLAP
jgi:hypothetical protein